MDRLLARKLQLLIIVSIMISELVIYINQPPYPLLSRAIIYPIFLILVGVYYFTLKKLAELITGREYNKQYNRYRERTTYYSDRTTSDAHSFYTNERNDRYHRHRTSNCSKNTSKTTKSNSSNVSEMLEKEDEWALKVLELSPSDYGDEEKIEEQFKELSKEKHPDVGGSTEEFKKIKKARDILVEK